MTSVLHIWDQAGVGCVIAKYQRKLGLESFVIKRDGFDPFGIMNFYNQKTFRTLFGFQFLKTVIKKSKDFDILHVHDLFQLLPDLKKRYPKKKIILHYHGTKLRTTSRSKRIEFEKNADSVLVSTPDLLSFSDAKYLPNPVDTEHFSSRNIQKNNLALCFLFSNNSEHELVKELEKHEIKVNLNCVNRKQKPIFYQDMPNFLSNYEYYVDIKFIYDNKPAAALSMTGLQALSLGMKVINYNYEVLNSLPNQHEPKRVVEKLNTIYGIK